MGMIEDNTFTQIGLLMGNNSARKIKDMFPGTSEQDLSSMVNHTGYGRFKKIHPAPFTFDCPSMDEYFKTLGLPKAQEWKTRYKATRYKSMDTIKDDILERYGLTQKNKLTEEDSASVRTGRATGRIKRVK
jgi:hypothetical protein